MVVRRSEEAGDDQLPHVQAGTRRFVLRGDDTFEAGIPESFNVLVKEMRSLGLSVELENTLVEEATAELPDAAE